MMVDIVSDFFTRVRNAQKVGHRSVRVRASKMVEGVLKVLKTEGFVESFEKASSEVEKAQFLVVLKYYGKGEPLIKRARRVSTPGCRVYTPSDKLPRVKSGLGICILSTSKGVMGDRDARAQGVGGEVIALVS